MPKPKEEPTSEPKDKEEPQAEPEPTKEPASPEPEPQEPPAPTADPFEGRTFEEVRAALEERYPDDLKTFTHEEWEKGRRHGQGEGQKQFEAEKKKWAEEQQALATFDRLEQQRRAGEAGDPEAAEQYARATGDPRIRQLYDKGQRLRRGPDQREVVANAVGGAMTAVYQGLKNRPELHGMTEEQHAEIREQFRRDPEPYTKLVSKYCDLIIERGVVEGRTKQDEKTLRDAKEQGRREAFDELGLEYPGEHIEGGGSKPEGKLPPLTTVAGILAAVRNKKLTEAEAAVRVRELAM
jgi:hypothetical protein